MPKKRKLLQQQMRGTKKPSQKHMSKEQTQKLKAKAGKGKPEADLDTPNAHAQDLKPTIPFSPEDAILLIGEGDLSFSKALVAHHYCENVTATVLESSLEELTAKYPQAKENVDAIEAEGSKVVFGVDAKKMAPFARKSGKESVGIMDRISMSPLTSPAAALAEYSRLTVQRAQSSTSLTSGARAKMSTARCATTRSFSSTSSSAPCSHLRPVEPSSSRFSRESLTRSGTSATSAVTLTCKSSGASASRLLPTPGTATQGRLVSSRTSRAMLEGVGKERTAQPVLTSS